MKKVFLAFIVPIAVIGGAVNLSLLPEPKIFNGFSFFVSVSSWLISLFSLWEITQVSRALEQQRKKHLAKEKIQEWLDDLQAFKSALESDERTVPYSKRAKIYSTICDICCSRDVFSEKNASEILKIKDLARNICFPFDGDLSSDGIANLIEHTSHLISIVQEEGF